MEYKTDAEILSPVGSLDMLQAAVRSGADAVYFGEKQFSARRNAENFTINELQNVISYCHIRGVKAYLTLNIILKDNELQEATNLAFAAYNYGIDGIIIQDLGLARILHNLLPQLPIHASTQMSVHSPSAIPLLKQMGFCQVVISREMSFKDIKEFCNEAKKYDMVVEAFVHGALCMCLSGQCLLSSFFGSRSGNRGLCAGPCRLPFSVENGTGHDLSLKDLSLIKQLNNLYEAGVRSFKIEGRMKRPEYVAAATSACRQSIDSDNLSEELYNTLKNVFSRSGFTDGYFTNNLGREMFGIRTKEDVISADDAFPELHKLYRIERQSVKINSKIIIKENQPVSLTISDGINSVNVKGINPQKALSKEVCYDSVLSNINKFGNTPYILNGFKAGIDPGLFVRSSEINELRRRACEALDNKRSNQNLHSVPMPSLLNNKDKVHSQHPKIVIRIENYSQLPNDLTCIDKIIYPLEAEKPDALPKTIPLVVDIPRGIISEKIITEKLIEFKSYGFTHALCGNLSAVKIAKKLNYTIIGDTGLNIYNSQSALKAQELGLEELLLSNEILISDAIKLYSPINKGIIAYGRIPLMIFKNCPIRNGKSCKDCDHKGKITDRKNVEFPIRCRLGYSELLNSVPIFLADRLSELAGLDFIVLYFTDETGDEVNKVINAYKNNLPPYTKYTRGLFYRGTL